jgi:hypothetical protein
MRNESERSSVNTADIEQVTVSLSYRDMSYAKIEIPKMTARELID